MFFKQWSIRTGILLWFFCAFLVASVLVLVLSWQHYRQQVDNASRTDLLYQMQEIMGDLRTYHYELRATGQVDSYQKQFQGSALDSLICKHLPTAFPYLVVTNDKGEHLTPPVHYEGTLFELGREDLERSLGSLEPDIIVRGKVSWWVLSRNFDDWGWSITLAIPEKVTHHVLDRFLLTLLLILFGVGVVGMLILNVIVQKTFGSLDEMVKSMEQVSRGDLECSIIQKKPAGFLLLVEAFEKMCLELKSSQLRSEEHVKNLEREVKARTAEVKAQHQQLVHTEKMASLGIMATSVAHEINDPLGFILSNVDVLKKFTNAQRKYFRACEHLREAVLTGDQFRSVALANDIVYLLEELRIEMVEREMGDLFDDTFSGLTRIKDIVTALQGFSADANDYFSPVDIHQTIENALKIIIAEVRIKAILKKEYGAAAKVHGSSQQLSQVFINLLLNAVQAIEVHGEITIKTYQQDDTVVVAIKDTGTGVSKENMDKLFRPFFTTKAPGKGIGLGLHIGLEIIKKHGGDIKVASQLGEGSVFRVFLPIDQGNGTTETNDRKE